jgi:endonuclease/exonuclease/phosphatase family metal-dependent hydrolase
MTWNIHSGVGPDGRFDLTRVVEVIARNRPDVVALQEVDSRRTQAPARSAFVILREAVGDHGIDAKSISTADGEYGQAVISRWPLGRNQIHDITHLKREPRRAIEVEIAAPAGPFRLIATHFGLSLLERREQARRLLAIAHSHAMTTVMLGDFNEWFWPGPLCGARRGLSRDDLIATSSACSCSLHLRHWTSGKIPRRVTQQTWPSRYVS